MEILDLKASKEFSPTHHVYKTLAETPNSAISVVGWEPGQTSPIHSHPDADEIYHVLEGEGLFNDGNKEVRLGPARGGATSSTRTRTATTGRRVVSRRARGRPGPGCAPASWVPAAPGPWPAPGSSFPRRRSCGRGCGRTRPPSRSKTR